MGSTVMGCPFLRVLTATRPQLMPVTFLALGLAIAFPHHAHAAGVARTGETAVAQSPAVRARAIRDQAISDFRNGRLAESASGFDELARLLPDYAPQLWQRGIALYYVRRYEDCRRQFELHRTVNPNDVENAAWHFLCIARSESPERAKAELLPVGADRRVPMRQIYEMFRGTLDAEEVLSDAGTQPTAEFYAHLYVGLYFEALGRQDLALEHITTAAADRYAPVGGYMHTVARVHRDILQGGP